MRLPTLLALVLSLAASAAHGEMLPLRSLVPAGVHGDSLLSALHGWEARDRGPRGAAAVWYLAGWHQARGEYGQARAAYLRAARRLSGLDRLRARLGAGRAALALGAPAEAAAAVGEALRGGGSILAEARLIAAQALEMEGDRQKALALYSKCLAESPGEVGASALERIAAVHEALKHTEAAAEARARLQREYPASPEASRTPSVPPPAAARRSRP